MRAHTGVVIDLESHVIGQEVKQLPVNWVSTYQWEESEQ